MKVERWYWLVVFCVVSLGIHGGVLYNSRELRTAVKDQPAMMEITLAPLEATAVPPVTTAEVPKEEIPPVPEAQTKPEPLEDANVPLADIAPPSTYRPPVRVRLDEPEDPLQKEPPLVQPNEKVPVAANAEPGGEDPTKDETPVKFGAPNRPRSTEPLMTRQPKVTLQDQGGGSTAPSVVLGGKGGANAPDAPPEDVVYNGGGAGGDKLPKETARTGGGGGKSILSVENPLAKEAIPDDRPGLGSGRRGGQGTGINGGIGSAVGRGIGTNPDGKVTLSTLSKTKPGAGIGASVGEGVGTNPPKGSGTGSETPGTGGEGTGYGRGNGIGTGDGETRGVAGLSRGIPFGNLSGLLKGDEDGGGGKDGGPGGPGRGAVFGARPVSSRGGRMAIVYTLDISGSMRAGGKIKKAKEALKQALSELKRNDTFGIVTFAAYPTKMDEKMLSATTENITKAMNFVDAIEMRDGTNFSDAMAMALSYDKVSHIYMMSDGEPHGGIVEPPQLRAFIREKNIHNVIVMTLALGLGEDSPGFELLKAIASDNRGKYNYINLGR